MLELETSSIFRKDYKRIKRRGYKLELLEIVIEKLLAEETLEPKYRDHALFGNYIGYRECHIQADWLLIYRIERDTLHLVASRTGSHSDLFNM